MKVIGYAQRQVDTGELAPWWDRRYLRVAVEKLDTDERLLREFNEEYVPVTLFEKEPEVQFFYNTSTNRLQYRVEGFEWREVPYANTD